MLDKCFYLLFFFSCVTACVPFVDLGLELSVVNQYALLTKVCESDVGVGILCRRVNVLIGTHKYMQYNM